MSDEIEKNEPAAEPSPPNEAVKLENLALELSFVPEWARKSSQASSYDGSKYEDSSRGRDTRSSRGGAFNKDRRSSGSRDRDDRDRRDRARPAGGGRRPSPERSPDGQREYSSPAMPSGGRPDGGGPMRRQGPGAGRPERPPLLPVDVAFIPDRDRLGAIVRQIHALKRAFPLPYLAGLFLSKPDYHMIKLEAKPAREGGEPLQFFQCRETRMVFLERDALNDYLVRTHLEKHFEKVEQTLEPPVGNFVVVGQCRRSGTVLGPPNYHGYAEKLIEVHRAHFPGMSLDQYRNSIDMVRDPAVIEKWKEECRSQVRYRLKDEPEAEANLTLMQAEAMFLEKFAPAYSHIAGKTNIPATVFEKLTDSRLRLVIQVAGNREERFPLTLMLALRPAFRRMRLHLFKAGKDETYVTAIPPKPFDAEHAIPAIKDVVALIAAHPGSSRANLVEKLFPGKAIDDPEVIEALSPLIWLIDKGHVIEFFNGTYAIPGHLRSVTIEEAPTTGAVDEVLPVREVVAPPVKEEPVAEANVDASATDGSAFEAPPVVEEAPEVKDATSLPE